MPDYIRNMFTLMTLVSEEDTVKKFRDDFDKAAIRYGEMKKQMAEDMVQFIRPIRERAKEIKKDENYLRKLINQGAEKARESAGKTIREVRSLTGLKF
jgi:tryptophanyl-tRNA synthetase